MPPRPLLPADDLYARLELPIDASAEAIEIAWRALLKRHHPDIAGPAAVEVAKRINVAHDWLSDPVLRERYDRERHPRARRGSGAADRSVRGGAWAPRDREGPPGSASRAARPRPPARPPRPVDPALAIAQHLDRIRRLTEDELDRLGALPVMERARLAGLGSRPGTPGDLPWPRGLSPTDDAALRVSSVLAQRDATTLLPDPVPAVARRSLARAMHALVLRHGFPRAELERLAGPWASVVLPPRPATAGARRA